MELIGKNDGNAKGIAGPNYGAFPAFKGRLEITKQASVFHELAHCLGIGDHDDDPVFAEETYCSDGRCYMSKTDLNNNKYCSNCFDDMFAADDAFGVNRARIWNKWSVDEP